MNGKLLMIFFVISAAIGLFVGAISVDKYEGLPVTQDQFQEHCDEADQRFNQMQQEIINKLDKLQDSIENYHGE